MSNFRVPVNVFLSTLSHRASFSSGLGEKAGQELLKQVNIEDKIKTEKFRNFLPYLQQRNRAPSSFKPAEKQPIFKSPGNGQEPFASELTNIFDTLPVSEIPKEPSLVHGSIPASENSPSEDTPRQEEVLINVSPENSKENQSLISPADLKLQPQSLPVVMVTKVKSPIADLSNAVVPLSFHLKDSKGLLVDAVVQDLKLAYSKTSSTLDGWYVVARTQGRLWYITAEAFMKDPGALQKFVKHQALPLYRLKEKNALSIYDPKLTAIANIDFHSIIEKIKHWVENIIASIKKALGKGATEKKKEGGPDKKEGASEKKEPEVK